MKIAEQLTEFMEHERTITIHAGIETMSGVVMSVYEDYIYFRDYSGLSSYITIAHISRIVF
jgi:precorrin-4 methylase